MTLLVNRGERDEAAALAEAAQTASENEFDPWWTYWLGDFPSYPALLDKLRELATMTRRRGSRAEPMQRRRLPARLPMLAGAVMLGASLVVAAAGLVAAAAGSSQAAPPPQDPAPVFRAGADIVTVEASVRRDRRAVVGLDGGRFRAARQRRGAGDQRRHLREAADRRHGPPRCQLERHRAGPRRAAALAEATADRPRRARSAAHRHVRHAHPPDHRLRRSAVGHRLGARRRRGLRKQRRLRQSCRRADGTGSGRAGAS